MYKYTKKKSLTITKKKKKTDDMSSASPDSSYHCGDRKIKEMFFFP